MKKVYILLIVAILLLSFYACANNEQKPVKICMDESVFCDFYVEDGVVHFLCQIKVINTSSENQTFKISGFSQEDVKIGLLIDDQLIGFNTEDQSDLFIVNADSSCVFNVDFRGEFAGIQQKTDRLLPNVMEIEIVD